MVTVQKVQPPESLLIECPERPIYSGSTWGDILDFLQYYDELFELCSGEHESLIQWLEKVKDEKHPKKP